MALTNRLNKLMAEKGLNKAELAKGAGLPYMTVSNLWKLGAENIKLSTMSKLADFLEVTLDDLVYETSNQDEVDTIAAHHDGEEWTEEELETIQKFKEFVRSQRKG